MKKRILSLALVCLIMIPLLGTVSYAAESAITSENIDDSTTQTATDITARGVLIASAIKNEAQAELSTAADNSDIEDISQYEELEDAITIHYPESTFSTRDAEGRTIYGALPTISDVAEYKVEIDHSVLPQVVLYAFSRGATGDAKIEVLDGTKVIKTVKLVNRSIGSSSTYWPKNCASFSDTSGAVKTYTIRVSTSTGNAAFAITLGTKDTFIGDYGRNNYATVAKNIPSEKVALTEDVGWFPGSRILLNTAEWFHYTADGYTYITARISGYNNLAFAVIDVETEEIVYESSSADRGTDDFGDSVLHGYVEKGLDLEPGRDYLIGFYCTSPVNADIDDFYAIHIGLPFIVDRDVSTSSSTSYSVSAGATKRFTIDVSGFPNSARAGNITTISFNAGNLSTDGAIESCVLTDPYGNTYRTQSLGKYINFHLDPVDFWGRHNTPLNGKWTVEVKAARNISGLKFRILSHYKRILGQDGD